MSKRTHSETSTDTDEETPSTSIARDSGLLTPRGSGALTPLRPPSARRKCNKKRVTFDDVTLYYFQRSQGFTCVPSVGGTTLGMTDTHLAVEKVPMKVFESKERKEVDRARRFDSICTGRSNAPHNDEHAHNNALVDESSCEGIDDVDSHLEEEEDDEELSLQPLATKDRRAMLTANGVKVDNKERDECNEIRSSRQYCGCDCVDRCDPATCQCAINRIKCQVDRPSFPCACTRQGCENPSGRVEFNPFRVRSHYMHTMMRLRVGTDEPTAYASPTGQHMRFDNQDSYCDNGAQQWHNSYGLGRFPSFNVDNPQPETHTYTLSHLYEHVTTPPASQSPQEPKEMCSTAVA